MFRDERITGAVPHGWSIDEIIGQMVVEHAIHPGIIPALRVSVWSEIAKTETFIPYEQWKRVRPKPGCSLRVHAVPMGGGGGGGKSPVKMIAMLAIMVVAAVVTAGVGAALIGAASTAGGSFAVGGVVLAAGEVGMVGLTFAGTVVATMAGAAVSMIGNALINAVIPTSSGANRSEGLTTDYGSSVSSPTYSIMGVRNRANPFGVVPKLYGRRRVYPMLAANTYTETVGTNQYFRALFCFGYGPLQIDDIRIGDTPISEFAGVEYEVRQGYDNDARTTLFTRSVHEESLSVELANGGGSVVTAVNSDLAQGVGTWRTVIAREIADALEVIVRFPSGLKSTVTFEVELDEGNDGSWVSLDPLVVTNDTTSAFSAIKSFNVTRGKNSVRVRRTADAADVKSTWQSLVNYTPVVEKLLENNNVGRAVIPGGAWVDQPIKDYTYKADLNIRFTSGLGPSNTVTFVVELDEGGDGSWVEIDTWVVTNDSTTDFIVTKSFNVTKGRNRFRIKRLADSTGKPSYWKSITETVEPWVVRSTSAQADEISVDVNFPRGLARITGGTKGKLTVDLSVEYSPIGQNNWISAGIISVTDSTTSSVRGSLRWSVTNGQYDVRLKRNTPDSTDDTILDKTYWGALRTITSEYPINMPGLALLAIRIKATDQLNGVIETLNAVCTSMLPVWNGSVWSSPVATRNPAWAWCDVLRGRANNVPTRDEDIDLATVLTWANACDAPAPNGTDPMWQYDAVHDKATTVDQMLRDIAAAGRARYIRRDGKESVLRDVAQTTAFQHFTPRNSWGFKSVKTFVDHPHGLKCRIINPDIGWQEDEVIVYADGYNENNADLFEQLDMLFCTNSKQAWRDGRYHMAAAKLRPALYEINTDVENFACQPGDLVYVAYDVPLWGQWQSRIQDITFDGGGQATGITLDSTVTMAAGKTYVVRIRRTADNSTLLQAVNTVVGETDTLTFTNPIAVIDIPAVDDLVLFGETNEESVRLIVKSINRGQDMSARIVMVDEAPEVHTSYTGTIPDFESHITYPASVVNSDPLPPVIREVWENEVLISTGVVSKVFVSLTTQTGGPVAADAFEVQYRIVDSDRWNVGTFVNITSDVILDDISAGLNYEIRARATSKYGKVSSWVTTTYTAIGLGLPPEDVQDFRINALDTTAYLSWSSVSDPDLSHYVIKWSSITTGANWAESQIIVQKVDTVSIIVPALSGTYLIKAVDTSGSESVNATLVTNGVSGIQGMNAITTVTEDPSFVGTYDGTRNISGGVELEALLNFDEITNIDQVNSIDFLGDDVKSFGYYYFANDLDLTSTYTSRLTAAVAVAGVNYVDKVDSWINVDQVADWDGNDLSRWSIELQVRTSDDNATWGAWQTFVVGDYKARAFQWRIKLMSSSQGLTPRVTALSVTIDMPDRLASDNDVACPTPGLTVLFAPAFKEAPSLAIAAQDMLTGDYKTLTSISQTGFTIRYYNASGTPVARTFDWVARGYGYVA